MCLPICIIQHYTVQQKSLVSSEGFDESIMYSCTWVRIIAWNVFIIRTLSLISAVLSPYTCFSIPGANNITSVRIMEKNKNISWTNYLLCTVHIYRRDTRNRIRACAEREKRKWKKANRTWSFDLYTRIIIIIWRTTAATRLRHTYINIIT